jgi:hypothetical protein
MERDARLISAGECCEHYNIQYHFVKSLHDSGLIEIHTIEEKSFIAENQLPELEQYSRMHYELNINVEGIEAIAHLLGRLKTLQAEVSRMKRRLNLYENAD